LGEQGKGVGHFCHAHKDSGKDTKSSEWGILLLTTISVILLRTGRFRSLIVWFSWIL